MQYACKFISFLWLVLGVAPCALSENPGEIEALRKELQELRRRTEQIETRLQQMEKSGVVATNSPLPAVTAPSDPSPTPWSPAQPITALRQGNSFLNISLDGLATAGGSTAKDIEILQPGGHDPNQRGFTLQNLEATFDGVVDPYFRAQANVVFQLDRHSSTSVEVEAAWLETFHLPANLQLRAGQILTDFGRLNPTHPHTWNFVDAPLVNARLLGPDGLRNPGARLSWLVPTPFYSELAVSVQNSAGETAESFRFGHDGDSYLGRPQDESRIKRFSDLLITPRYSASFDLTRAQTILAGASAAFGPNSSGQNERTEIYGLDLFWKWKPSNQSGGFPFLSWQTEAMFRRYHAGAAEIDFNGTAVPLDRELIEDYGLYSQVAWGFHKGWVAALRGDYVAPVRMAGYERVVGADPARAERWRVSPNITWFPTEFSKIRLQYNLDHREIIGVDHSLWLQFEFLLGSHGAHKF